MLFSGIVCTAFANWAMTMVNRSLPAVTTSLCLLATPLLGIASATVILGEPLEPSLFAAMTLIIGGIALGTVGGGSQAASSAQEFSAQESSDRLALVRGQRAIGTDASSHIRQIVKRSISEVSCRASNSWISVPSRFVSAGDSTSRSDATAEIREAIRSFRVAAPLAVRYRATSRPSFPGRRSTS